MKVYQKKAHPACNSRLKFPGSRGYHINVKSTYADTWMLLPSSISIQGVTPLTMIPDGNESGVL